MKYLFVLLLLIPNLAKADFSTGLIVGSLLSSGPKTTIVEVKDEFAKQVEQIELALPNNYEPVTQSHYSFSVIPEEAKKYVNYFKNGDYQLSYQEGTITFDLTARYVNYLAVQAESQAEQKAFDQKWEAYKPIFKNIAYLALALLVFISLIKAITDLSNMGILGWFYRTETKLIKKLLKDLDYTHKK